MAATSTTGPTNDLGNGAALVELVVADPPEAWAAAGFTVVDDTVAIGATTIRLTGADGSPGRGIERWVLGGVDPDGLAEGTLDGLPTTMVSDGGPTEPDREDPSPHPNGVTGFDHIVVMTPDLERTTEALGRIGLACRRIRETTSYGAPMRQGFFRLGPTILEVVSGEAVPEGERRSASDAPAAWFGLAVDVVDLDATAALLGDGLGAIKAAVQEGRRIATLRHKALGLSVAVAAMDDHGGR